MTTANKTSTDGGRSIMYREALNEALREEMHRDPTVFCMGVGIGQRGGSYKVTAGLLDEFGPKRVIDTPISEASFTGAGVGAAITGMRPVVEILFVDGGSSDGTQARIQGWRDKGRVRLVQLDAKGGLAGDVLHAARSAEADVVVVTDADLSHPPESIPALIM